MGSCSTLGLNTTQPTVQVGTTRLEHLLDEHVIVLYFLRYTLHTTAPFVYLVEHR
jgi:hypothetical protein